MYLVLVNSFTGSMAEAADPSAIYTFDDRGDAERFQKKYQRLIEANYEEAWAMLYEIRYSNHNPGEDVVEKSFVQIFG